MLKKIVRGIFKVLEIIFKVLMTLVSIPFTVMINIIFFPIYGIYWIYRWSVEEEGERTNLFIDYYDLCLCPIGWGDVTWMFNPLRIWYK